MGIGLQVSVIDANGAPIKGAVVVGDFGTATTNAGGTVDLGMPESRNPRLTVKHPYYVTEDVTFEPDYANGSWDNSLVTRQVTKTGVNLQFQLGRGGTAPTVLIEESDVPNYFKGNANPGAAIIASCPTFPGTFSYRNQYNINHSLGTNKNGETTGGIRVAAPSRVLLFPPPLGLPGPNAYGWDRFQNEPRAVNVATAGRFFWFLYPQQPDPAPGSRQYAVAIWSPRMPDGQNTAVTSLDMIVLYSPTTAGKPTFEQARYPFGLVAGENPSDSPYQPYMKLGNRYILDEEFFFALQLAANNNQAVLVMPICAAGDWGSFQYGEGVLRLLREVAVFLHRECRTSNLGDKVNGSNPYRFAGGSTRSPSFSIRGKDFGAVPIVGKVAVAFFSNGYTPVSNFLKGSWSLPAMGTPSNPPVFTSQYWGTPNLPPTDSARVWSTAWRELWDMDGYHPEGWQAPTSPTAPCYLDNLKAWFGSKDGGRIIRLCDSSGRIGSVSNVDPSTCQHPLFYLFRKEGYTVGPLRVPQPAGKGSFVFGDARELQGERWSVVAFDDRYVLDADQSVLPMLSPDLSVLQQRASKDKKPVNDLIDFQAHHSTARIAFSYATSLTSVGTRQGTTVRSR
jgi:hypothetical protein